MTGAQFEIRIDATPRSYRDRKDYAMEAARLIKSKIRTAWSRSKACKAAPALGMTPVCDTDKLFYCVGARTAIGIQPAGPAHDSDRFAQSRVGLHHLCLRARSREDVDRLHDLLRQIGATVVQAPQEGTWAPGYYSVLFEDPDGIRLEANFVPGAGVLQPGVKFNAASGY